MLEYDLRNSSSIFGTNFSRFNSDGDASHAVEERTMIIGITYSYLLIPTHTHSYPVIPSLSQPRANNETSEVVDILLPMTFYFNSSTRLARYEQCFENIRLIFSVHRR